MKKNYTTLLLIVSMFVGFSTLAQTYNMSNTTINGCSGTFYDPGGTGDYASSTTLITMTFCSSTADEINLDFTGLPFQVETSFDFLNIYDGVGTGGTNLWNSQTAGGAVNPGLITSTTGCLTVTFSSDGSVQYSGWEAVIFCGTPSCTDGVLNNGETSIDCGGPNCTPCPSCFDGIQNQGETGIDCGGPCVPCSCTDGIQNNGETGIDCGGPSCNPCPVPCAIDLTYTTAPDPLGCNGGDIVLTAVGEGEHDLAMNNDFNGGTVGNGWVSTGGAAVGTPCGVSLDGTDYYWASTSTGTPNLTTAALDVSCGGVLSFDMAYSTQGGAAPCEGPDEPDEGVTFQYSTDGGLTWVILDYWDPLGGYDPTMTTWNNYSFTIPPGAMGPNTQFQWIQLNSSGTCCDNWGVDNVSISSVVNCDPYYYDYTHIPGTDDNPVDNTTIGSTTTYGVWYGNGTDSCYTDVTIVVPPGTTADAGPDQVFCSGSTGVTIGADPVSLDVGAIYTWSTGQTGTIGGDNGQITVAPLVTTDYFLDVEFNGCKEFDTVRVVVDVPPTASNPTPINVECSADVPAPNTNVVTDEADDITIPPTVTFLNDASDGNTCPEIITRTYRVTDACANFVDVQQTITILDVTAPNFSAPPGALNVECIGDVPAMTNLNYTDNCDANGSVAGTDVSDNGSCPEIITRTWTYTDACGNPATETQTITVIDTQAPNFSAPPGATSVECVGDVPAMINLNYTDNCDANGSVAGTDVSDNGSCPEIITRTWTYTDACGNPATETQTITVIDTQAPVFSATPADAPYECVGDIPAAGLLAFTDNCDANGSVTGTDGPLVGGPCGGTVTRTWTYTDACGNNATVSQVFTINDVTPPTASNLPAQAGTPPAANINDVFDEADNCDPNPVVTFISDVSDGGNCPEIITRTYRITDACGNFVEVTQLFSIGDAIFPTADIPLPITVECVGDVPVQNPLVVTNLNDNGATPTVMHISDVSDNGSCPEIITRTYRVTDDCGNFIDVQQTITIIDTQAPVFAATPVNTTVECVGDVPVAGMLGYTDNCDAAGSVLGTDVSDNGSCPEIITRTWTYTDVCGNNATVTQTITIIDTQAPAFAAPPANIVVECIGDVPVAGMLGYTDNCDAAGSVLGTDVSDNGSCPEIITRTWTFTDACGNPATETQTITVIDTQAPVFSATPADAPYECVGDIPAAGLLAYTDNCDANGTVMPVDGPLVGGPCGGTVTRTWTYTDACGNNSTVSQVFTINDVTPPTASNLPAQAGTPPAANINDVFDEADNCDPNPVVTFISDVSDGGNCPEIITRTYRITDACGNSVDVTQMYTVGDAIFPSASNPTPITVECIGDVPGQDPLVVTDETDNGATPSVAHFSDVSDNGSCPEIITRTYRVTDDCGNFIDVQQTITIIDTQAPVFAATPANATVECVGDVPVAGMLGYTDNCDAAGSVLGTDVSDNGSCPEIITRTWTYTDACGNNATVTQTITIIDTQAPVFAATPANVSVECIGDVPVAGMLGYTDNCDAAGSVLGTDVSDNGSCPEIITRTWTYTDACGNNATVTQTITVIDTQAPVFAATPVDITVECVGDVPVAGMLGYTDNCDAAGSVLGTDGVLVGGACGGTITRTWTYTDACGNIATVTQTITVDDTIDPTASNPATTTVPGGPAPAVDITVVIDEADNCTVNPVVAFISESTDNAPCPETITRIYSVTDDCGNSINVTHIILITDPFLPTATNPVGVTVECIGDVPAQDPLVVIDEADNQGVPTVLWVSDVSDNGSCPEIITRTYSVTDVCGGVIFVQQTITIIDTQVPVFAATPVDVTVECIGDVPVAGMLGYTDNCDAAGSVLGTDVSDNGSCPEIITRTWTYTDACGNNATVTQTITIIDTQAPVFAATPVDVTVECIGDVPVAGMLGYTDNCDAAGSILGTDVSDNGSCPEIITRTWTYTDACGNNATVTQTITVIDTQAPVFATTPIDVTVECIGDVPVAGMLGYSDNCDVAGSVLGTDGALVGGACGGTITRTWTYTDACGNNATVTQTITVDDTIDPTASNPVTTTVPGGPAPAVDITVVIDEADNCTVNPVVAFVSEATDNGSCPETITRIYSVTDDCGNSINVSHIILITDPIMPTASNPLPINVECIGDVPASDILVVTDEADNQGTPIVAFVSDVSDGNTCPEVITRTYSVTDVCNNEILVTQTITVNDITAPVASNPVAVNVQCIGDVPANNVADVIGETDNCTAVPLVTFVSDVSDGNTCPEVITRTYSVTDDCDNETLVTQTITVNDDIAPVASNLAAVNVECIGDVPTNDVADVIGETDNCTVIPTVTFVSDISDGNTCPEVITRTYSVTDDCGNETMVTQIITVNDVTAPVASNPVAISVPGSMDVPVPDITDVIGETDNCTAAPIVAFESDVSDNNTCNGEIITRTYSVTDDCGNQTLVTQFITILAVTPPISATDTLICENESAILFANNPMGVPISWDNGIQDGTDFYPAATTIYTVTADNLGCLNTATATVTVEVLPDVQFFGDVLSGCAPLYVNFTNQSSTSSSLVDCVWDFEGAINSVSGCTNVSYTFPQGGTYDVTLTTTSINGCSNSATYADYIYVEDIPVAAFSASSVDLTTISTEVEFTNESVDATTYDWSFGDFTSTTVENPIHQFPDDSDGSYIVQLNAYSPLGCKDSAVMVISIEEELIYYVPNTFTPDGDSYNNTFRPIFTSGYDPYDFHMTIFNRWGEIIFETFDDQYGWDGTYNGKLMQDGTYTWKIEFKQLKNDKHIAKLGHVTILR